MDAQLHISTDEEVINPVCDFTYSWCLNCGLPEPDAIRFTVAISELITDIILFAYPHNSQAHFDIEYRHTLSNVELIVSEFGEPFDPDRHRFNVQEACEEGNFEGAGFRLIRRFCDEFLFINKGKDGKEFRLIKKIHLHDIDELLEQAPSRQEAELDLTDEQGTDQLEENLAVTQIRPSDAEDIAKLIYRTYEYSYPKEDLYFPKKIEKAVLGKEKLGVIARNNSGEAVGYFAVLKMSDSNIAEVGEAVVSLDSRRKGIMSRMMKHLIKIAERQKLDALFGKAITIHPISQKVNNKYGYISTALMLGVTDSMLVKGFDKNHPQPISELIDFLPIFKPKMKTIYVPDAYKEIVLQTCDLLEFPVTIKEPSSPVLARRSNIDLSIDYSDHNASIIVNKYGSDFKAVLEEMLSSLISQEDLNSIYLDLPLQNEATPGQFKELKSLGFIYCGLLPLFHHEADFLRLQKNLKPLDLNLININFEFGKKIKSLIADEYHNNT